MTAFLSATVIRWAQPYGLITDGDSIDEGYDPEGAVTPYSKLVPCGSQRLDVGVTGQRIGGGPTSMTSRFPTFVAPWAQNAILVAEGGFNDMLQGDTSGSYQTAYGSDGASTYARLLAYVALARAAGVRAVVFLTCLSVAPGTTYYTANLVAQIAIFNGLARTAPAGTFDAIADVAAAAIERNATDGLHPDAAGQVVMAAVLAPALASVLP